MKWERLSLQGGENVPQLVPGQVGKGFSLLLRLFFLTFWHQGLLSEPG